MMSRSTKNQCVGGQPRHQCEARPGLTLIEVVVVLMIFGVLVVLFLPALEMPRGEARRTHCKNNLKQIGLALHNYHDTYGAFPPAYTVNDSGEKLHSWRTLILPFLEQESLYDSIDLSKPWNDPVNRKAYETTVPSYSCPGNDLSPTATTYLGMVGEECLFHPKEPRHLVDITDGTNQTLMVVEAPFNFAVHWMAPDDIDNPTQPPIGKGSIGVHGNVGNVTFADGSVRSLDMENLKPETWHGLATIAAGDELDAGDF
ncbi:MAG: DUF1559 domain-containing protein [Planctomycetaceae bacterium]|nr:DUF1559 domain-containing protein [Planctomycetaceae bacterium]